MRSGTGNKRIAAVERMRHAYELRKVGLSYAEVAKRAGYANENTALKAVQRATALIERDSAEMHEVLSEQRLLDMMSVAYVMALKGDLGAMDRVVRIQERLDQMHGVTGIAGGTNINQAVILVGGDEASFTRALEEASTRQAALSAGDDTDTTPEDWDAWEEHTGGAAVEYVEAYVVEDVVEEGARGGG